MTAISRRPQLHRVLQMCSIALIWPGLLSVGGVGASPSLRYGDSSSSSPSSSSSSSSAEPYSAPNYRFQYGVFDSKYNNDFGHEEERNGQEARGKYKVQLPDGRLQVVTYVADKNGYRAEVNYENSPGYSPAPVHISSAPTDSSSVPAQGNGKQGYSNSQSSFGRSFSTLKTKINGMYYGY